MEIVPYTLAWSVHSDDINLFISFSETLDKLIEEENRTCPWSRDLLANQAIACLTYT